MLKHLKIVAALDTYPDLAGFVSRTSWIFIYPLNPDRPGLISGYIGNFYIFLTDNTITKRTTNYIVGNFSTIQIELNFYPALGGWLSAGCKSSTIQRDRCNLLNSVVFGEMFEGDFADMCMEQIPVMLK